MELNQIYCGDCLELMPQIPDKSIDMILCDLPYVTTACKWDVVIPFEPLWEQYLRIIKDDGAIALFSSQPFTTQLISSNMKLFKYELIWHKNTATGIAQAKYAPMKDHETICIFYKKRPTYNPIMQTTKSEHIKQCSRKKLKRNITSRTDHNSLGGVYGGDFSEFVYPRTVLQFNTVNNRSKDKFHPTQKPVALFEYLIKTYTNEGDIVLDNCAGSGTAGVACKNLNRNFILIEKDPQYYEIARRRIMGSFKL